VAKRKTQIESPKEVARAIATDEPAKSQDQSVTPPVTQSATPTPKREEEMNGVATATERLADSEEPAGAIGRARMTKTLQRAVGNTRVSEMVGAGAPDDVYEQEANRAADSVMRTPVGEKDKQLAQVERPVGKARVGQRGRSGQPPQTTLIQRQSEGDQEAQPAKAGGSEGKDSDAGSAPSYVTKDLKQKVTATILAESHPGQMADIRWVYYNRVTSAKGEGGLKGSAAYINKGIWYKVWLYMLGDHTYGGDVLPKERTEFKGFSTLKDFCEKNGYMQTIAAERAGETEKLVDEMFDKPATNPYAGWIGQGNLDDFNNKSKPKDRYWKMARDYYWLQRKGKVKDIYVKVLPAGKNTQVIFDAGKIEKYYRDHDLPAEVPLYEQTE
jgi:hypothetical protein